jgi:c-di-GMP-binding flagellar brake protein YcgR
MMVDETKGSGLNRSFFSNMKNQETMSTVKDQRRFPRISSENRVGYALYNELKVKIDQGTGRTLNLSQTGVLLETRKILDGAYIMLMTIDLEGKKVKVKGRVVVSRYDESSSRFLTGIEFIGPKDEQREAIVVFVKAYQHRKHQEAIKRVNSWLDA